MTAARHEADWKRGHAGTLVLGGAALAVPMLGLALLLVRPEWDLEWHHNPAHFWLVLSMAALSAVLAYATGVTAVRRADARVLLVSYAFLSSAGFLGLHALATPGVLLSGPNTGFVIATPFGLALGSVFAMASSLDLSGGRRLSIVGLARPIRRCLLAAIAAWATASLAQLPPLQPGVVSERASGVVLLMAPPAIALFAVAAARYVTLWRSRPSAMLIHMAAAFVLLGEAMTAVAFARDWHTSWWEWHVLMLAAFGLVAWGAHSQWHEERFADLYLDDTIAGAREMSILFADLQGFTAFSEGHDPKAVTAMLNAYLEVAIPAVVRRFGGDIDRIIGDAVMVTFNRRGDQPDHARRAAAAALTLQKVTSRVADEHPGWPRFRVGVNSGPVSVSLLGADGGRTHTVIGDTVNVASRLEAKAPVGGVAVSADTLARLPGAHAEPLGQLELKGKATPVTAYRLISLGADSDVLLR